MSALFRLLILLATQPYIPSSEPTFLTSHMTEPNGAGLCACKHDITHYPKLVLNFMDSLINYGYWLFRVSSCALCLLLLFELSTLIM